MTTIFTLKQGQSKKPIGNGRSVEKKPTSNAKLTKPFIQVGIFGVENNAVKTGNQMSKLGLQTNTFEFNEFC